MTSSKHFRSTLFATTMLASFVGSAALPSFAALDEVVVTAQKREQSLQDVPLSVTAFSGADLDKARVNDIVDLQTTTPALMAPSVSPPGQGSSFRLRGFGSPPFQLGIEAAVGTFIDGVYRSRSGAALSDMIDIERVEILKGPQGTLFGKNTTAGVVHVITNKPNFDGVSGSVEVGYGEHETWRARGYVNAPIVDDKVAVRLAGSIAQGDGWIDDIGNGDDYQDTDRHLLRGQVLFTPNENIDFNLSVDYSEIDESCCATVRLADGPFTAFNQLLLAPLAGSTVVSPPDPDELITANNDPNEYNAEDWGISGELNWDLGNVTLTSITAYREYDDNGTVDGDFMGSDIAHIDSEAGFELFSQEIRLAGSNDEILTGNGFDWVVGLYYADEEITRRRTFYWDTQAPIAFGTLPPPLIPAVGLATDDQLKQEAETWAVFGHVTVGLTENLSLVAGLRYNNEEKSGMGVFAQPNLAIFPPVNPSFDVSLDEEEFTGTVSLQYDWTDNLMTYATYSRGYKAGGVNLAREGAGLLGSPTDALFDPEFADHYELGLKTDGDRYRINAAYFLTQFEDMQAQVFVPPVFFVRNVDGAEAQGIEVESSFSLTDNIDLNAGLMWLDATFDDSVGPLGGIDPVGGRDLPWAPEFTGSLGIDLNYPLANSGWNWFGSGNVITRSSHFVDTDSNPESKQKSTDVWNFQTGVNSPDDRWTFSVWCRNCTDERYSNVMFNNPVDGFPGLGAARESYLARPRTWGVTAKATF